jgi:molecular chaperone GrpE
VSVSPEDPIHEDPNVSESAAGEDDHRRAESADGRQPDDQATAESAPGEDVSPEEPIDELALLRAELEEAKDRGLRSRAELENYKKRATRQIEEERRYANLPLMRDLLPVLDNVGRAIESAEKNQDAAGLLDGVKMVARQFHDVFRRHDCREIEALDKPFDPHLHQAVSQQPSDECPPNTVVNVLHSGFQLHDRVVRPSQVIVSTAKEEGLGIGD